MGIKEQVYDDEIEPLMAKILEIVKREKIGMHATFFLDPFVNDDGVDDQQGCTSHQRFDCATDFETERLVSMQLVAMHGHRVFDPIYEATISIVNRDDRQAAIN